MLLYWCLKPPVLSRIIFSNTKDEDKIEFTKDKISGKKKESSLISSSAKLTMMHAISG